MVKVGQMLNWSSEVPNSLVRVVKGDPFWEQYLRPLSEGNATFALHLAVMLEPFLSFMLDGRKTIESRFSAKRTAPFDRVHSGDVILLKKAGGPIVGLCLARESWFYKLNPQSWKTIREEFAAFICAQDPEFWKDREHASFATLIRVANVTSIEPIRVEKRDRRGWVVLTSPNESSLTLWQTPNHSAVEVPDIGPDISEAPSELSTGPHLFADSYDCVTGLHTYHLSKRINAHGHPICKHCGADLIDWNRLHRRDLEDSDYMFAQLMSDRLRSEWWTREFDIVAKKHALRKGIRTLEEAARARLTKSVGAAYPAFDGRQTPRSGNTIYYAQHALACCCRKCLWYWHGIPLGTTLSSDVLNYLTQLVMKYIQLRLPEMKLVASGAK